MTPERAKEIWKNRTPFGQFDMTDFEIEEIKIVWKDMPGYTCFADALIRISRNECDAIEYKKGQDRLLLKQYLKMARN